MAHAFEWISQLPNVHIHLHLVNTWVDRISQYAQDEIIVEVVIIGVVGLVVVAMEVVDTVTDGPGLDRDPDRHTTEIVIRGDFLWLNF